MRLILVIGLFTIGIPFFLTGVLCAMAWDGFRCGAAWVNAFEGIIREDLRK